MTETPDAAPKTPSTAMLILRGSIQFTVAMGIWGGLMFWGAGTFGWPRGWIHLALWVVTVLVNMAVLLKANRDVIAARLKPKPSSERSDRILLWTFLPVMLAVPLLAGLDAVRYEWSSVPEWGVYAGIALHAAGDALLLWTMVVNPYLEKTVRIQADRGHRVITTGPYAMVRHPMYVGVMLLFAGTPLLLGSLWTFVPVGLTVPLLIVRTVHEERLLFHNLPGYEEYAQRTRYRLIPGVW